MWTYIIRRTLYAIPILIGVNLITFMLFFVVNTPEDMARVHLGDKYVTQESMHNWIVQHGYDKPLFFNEKATGISVVTDTLFVQQTWKLFMFDYGLSDTGRNINRDISERMWPSLAIALPSLVFEILINILFALALIFFKGTYIDKMLSVLCVAMMSVSSLFYIIGLQYLLGKEWHWVPISGYESGLDAMKFVALPIIVSIIAGLGAGARWYRTLFLEEIYQDYVRTARAKGLSEAQVLWKHVLRNTLIPILTGVVVLLPALFMGSLLLESFFAIPGLGSYTIEAINGQDFAIVRAMVFLGSLLYVVGLLLTDISYTWVDPRVRFQ